MIASLAMSERATSQLLDAARPGSFWTSRGVSVNIRGTLGASAGPIAIAERLMLRHIHIPSIVGSISDARKMFGSCWRSLATSPKTKGGPSRETDNGSTDEVNGERLVVSLREKVLERRAAIEAAKERVKTQKGRWDTLPVAIRPYAEDIALYLRETWLNKYPDGASLRKLQRDVAFRMPIITSKVRRRTDAATTERPPKLEKEALEELVTLLEKTEGGFIVSRKTIDIIAPDGTALKHEKIIVRPSSFVMPAAPSKSRKAGVA
jgi:hypothetical protein